MTDIPRKALNLLIHDIRTPLGVAQGYVRLIRDGLLTDADERRRALVQTAESLGRIARYCAVASELSEATDTPTPVVAATATPIALALLAAPTLAEVSTWDMPLQTADLNNVFLACTDVRRLGDALLAVVATRRNGAANRMLAFDATGLLRIGSPAQLDALSAGPDADLAEPFDPWTGGHGLPLPLAVLRLNRHQVRIWTMRATPDTLGVQFPVAPHP